MFKPTATVYEIYDENENFLEAKVIKHRTCAKYEKGYDLLYVSYFLFYLQRRLYFGGICRAPQDVSVCYCRDKSNQSPGPA